MFAVIFLTKLDRKQEKKTEREREKNENKHFCRIHYERSNAKEKSEKHVHHLRNENVCNKYCHSSNILLFDFLFFFAFFSSPPLRSVCQFFLASCFLCCRFIVQEKSHPLKVITTTSINRMTREIRQRKRRKKNEYKYPKPQKKQGHILLFNQVLIVCVNIDHFIRF